MTLQPQFETPRLVVRPRILADTDACVAMDDEPEVLRFIKAPWDGAAHHRAFVEARTSGPHPDGLGYWTVLRDGLFVGWILLIPLDTVGPEVEIGWRLRRSAWGHGYAPEAAAPILRHGLDTLRLPAVIADIDPANLASQRVAEKIGMRPTGLLRLQDGPAIRYVAVPEPMAVRGV